MVTYGYGRVSTKDQKPDRQIISLKAAGLDERHILIDYISGKGFNRPQYNLLTGTPASAPLLRPGDLLIVTSLDRLGRNYTEMLHEWKRLTEELKVDIKILDIPILDTSDQENNISLERKFVCELVLQILSYVAEKERIHIKERQREGIEAAKLAGKKNGRPALKYPDNWKEEFERWERKEAPLAEILESLQLKSSSFYKLVTIYEAETGRKRMREETRGRKRQRKENINKPDNAI